MKKVSLNSPLHHLPLVLLALCLLFGLGLFTHSPVAKASSPVTAHTEKGDTKISLPDLIQQQTKAHPGLSGAYIFEKGEEALLARAWLTKHATKNINIQYFIWSSDNIGILAAEALLAAAQQGINVRVIVDDLLIDAPDEVMVALNHHPNIQIRIYNPKHSVGITLIERLFNVAAEFRAVNQRMHDKTFTVDESVSIIGGRNMADEYYDYNRSYNFRDRDVLLLGPVVHDVHRNFEMFWNSNLAIPLENLLRHLNSSITGRKQKDIYRDLHEYAKNPENFKPEVRDALSTFHEKFIHNNDILIWDDIFFTHDMPGKNESESMSGGGQTTTALINALQKAEKNILIQSPYLVMPEGGIAFFKKLIDRGVRIQISTNSLASTDNLQAFSGYAKQRKEILAAGIEIYEYKPKPAIQRDLIERYAQLEKEVPTFAIHAKSMVIDHELIFIGTFNLDPRSAHLNTEVGALIRNRTLAKQVEAAINKDIQPENSWSAATENPDRNASLGKRLRVIFWKLFPLTPLL